MKNAKKNNKMKPKSSNSLKIKSAGQPKNQRLEKSLKLPSEPVIGLTAINATDNPGPGVPLARSIKEALPKAKLIGLSYDAHDPGNYMDFLFDHTVQLPFPTRGWDEIGHQIQSLRSRFGLNIIIPSLDAELPLFISHQKELLSWGIQTLLPSQAQFAIREKQCLPVQSESWGFTHPKTWSVSSIEQLTDVLGKENSFPVYVKGNYYKAYLVHNLAQAILKFTEISDEWGFPILIQEPAVGKEINLIGLGDGQGNSCGMMVIKKLTTTSLGKIWTGISISHPHLLELGKAFIKNTKWKGPFELECIETKDGIVLIEINPRFPAWAYFATGSGLNLPLRMIQLLTDGKCPRDSTYEVGKLFVRYTTEIVTDLSVYSRMMTQER